MNVVDKLKVSFIQRPCWDISGMRYIQSILHLIATFQAMIKNSLSIFVFSKANRRQSCPSSIIQVLINHKVLVGISLEVFPKRTEVRSFFIFKKSCSAFIIRIIRCWTIVFAMGIFSPIGRIWIHAHTFTRWVVSWTMHKWIGSFRQWFPTKHYKNKFQKSKWMIFLINL